jgi:hypothetical protein
MKGLDDVTGKEPSTCKATSQPEFSLAASRKPSTRLEWRRACAISASSQFSRRAAPPVLAIGGNRLHKSFLTGDRGFESASLQGRVVCEPACWRSWTRRGRVRYRSRALRQKSRLSPGTPSTATKPVAPARRHGRPPTTTAKSTGGKHSSSNLGDQVLALATGKTQQEIAAECKGARANHVGAALSRHKRAGRIEERDGKLYAISQLLRDEVRAILAHRKGCPAA